VPDDTPLKPAAPPYPNNGSRADADAWIDAVMAPVRRAYTARQAALLHRITNLPPRRNSPAPTSATAPDTRRCAFCGSPQAWFGYSPPLTRIAFWTCRAHRSNADACAIVGTSPQPLKPTTAAQGD
jgi:hypothetical protein